MNREIEFRGVSYESNKFVYGWLLQNKYNTSKYFIRTFPNEDDDYIDVVVDKNTVGQYVGLKDKNGTKIFEGDIVQWCGNKMEIFWGEDIGFGYGFCWKNVKGDSYYHESMTGFIDEYEVIGNVWENKELLENE